MQHLNLMIVEDQPWISENNELMIGEKRIATLGECAMKFCETLVILEPGVICVCEKHDMETLTRYRLENKNSLGRAFISEMCRISMELAELESNLSNLRPQYKRVYLEEYGAFERIQYLGGLYGHLKRRFRRTILPKVMEEPEYHRDQVLDLNNMELTDRILDLVRKEDRKRWNLVQDGKNFLDHDEWSTTMFDDVEVDWSGLELMLDSDRFGMYEQN